MFKRKGKYRAKRARKGVGGHNLMRQLKRAERKGPGPKEGGK